MTELDRSTLSDQQLTRRFVQLRCEDSFRELVARHGPLVLAVCRRHLPTEHDAEDAVQATFLVFARKASSVRWEKSVGPWLYRVATRISANVRRGIQRRREESSSPEILAQVQSLTDLEQHHAREVFDKALSAMPNRYRDPLVLFYLEGRTRNEVATILGLSLGAVKTRLDRGRKRLRFQLAIRGVPIVAALLSIQQTRGLLAAEITESLIPRIADLIHGQGTSEGQSTSSEVMKLATQEIQSMTFSSLAAKGGVLMLAASATVAVAVPGLLPITVADDGPDVLIAQAAADDPFGSDADAAGPFKQREALADPFADPTGTAVRRPAGGAAADPFAAGPAAERGADPFGAEPANKTKRARSPSNAVMGSSYSVGEKRIMQSLREATDFSYLDTPLRDVLDDIQLRHDLPIVVDTQALEDYGIGTDTPVTMELSGISLRSAFKLMLSELDLTYIVGDDVLRVTTLEEAGEVKQIRVYRLDGIVAAGDKVVTLLDAMLREDGAVVSLIGDRVVVKDQFFGQQRVMDVLEALSE